MRILGLATFCVFLVIGSAAWALQQSQSSGTESGSDFWTNLGGTCGGMEDLGPQPSYQPVVKRAYATFGSTLSIQTSFSDEIIASATDPALN
jgi:hypothetical protein